MADTTTEPACAKVNLSLHVVGQRADGYHLLDTMVVFTGEAASDVLHIEKSDKDGFSISGTQAHLLTGDTTDNLVVRARDELRLLAPQAMAITITLEKNLPIASGIGGGSADAAAALRSLGRLWQCDHALLMAVAARLGADVPMCVGSAPQIARGIGDELTPIDLGVDLPAVLINPNVPVSTPAVFSALAARQNAPMPPLPKAFNSARDAALWIERHTRNDLQPPAVTLCPVIGDVLDALQGAGALMARMSGSGATCYGIFDTANAAKAAALHLAKSQPRWWVVATALTGKKGSIS